MRKIFILLVLVVVVLAVCNLKHLKEDRYTRCLNSIGRIIALHEKDVKTLVSKDYAQGEVKRLTKMTFADIALVYETESASYKVEVYHWLSLKGKTIKIMNMENEIVVTVYE